MLRVRAAQADTKGEAMAKQVTTIPASIKPFSKTPLTTSRKRRVAAYARVSTDSDEQFTSYEAQVDYYTNYIKARNDWQFAGVYTDEGITGTNTKKREGCKRMVKDALDGKIDLIVTKSASRFARNTVDSLTTIRKLKEHGTECFFEKRIYGPLTPKASFDYHHKQPCSGRVSLNIRELHLGSKEALCWRQSDRALQTFLRL